MGFIKIKSIEKPLAARPEKNKKSLALACIGMSLIFMVSVVMSGCVVHSDGHGYSHGKGHGRGHNKGHGRGHNKGHVKIKPHVGVSVTPMIVIGH